MGEGRWEKTSVWGQQVTEGLGLFFVGRASSGEVLGWAGETTSVSGKRQPRFGPVEGSGESEGFGVGFGERELRGLMLWDGSAVRGKDKDEGRSQGCHSPRWPIGGARRPKLEAAFRATG